MGQPQASRLSRFRGTTLSGSARSCLNVRRSARQVALTVFRPRLNGSAHAELALKHRSALAMIPADSGSTLGSQATGRNGRTKWERKSPMRGGFMICTATLGSGAQIGLTITLGHPRSILRDLQPGQIGSTGVAAGTTDHTTAGRRIGLLLPAIFAGFLF